MPIVIFILFLGCLPFIRSAMMPFVCLGTILPSTSTSVVMIVLGVKKEEIEVERRE